MASGHRSFTPGRQEAENCQMLLYIQAPPDTLRQISFLKLMKPSYAFSMLAAAVIVMGATGCAGPEKKFGRGLSNLVEPVRMGEIRREVEQTAIFYSPTEGYTRGFITGLNKTLVRTGVGVYELVTFPIPSYDPVLTDYLTPNPPYPASYAPSLVSGPTFDTDTSLGFSGGDVAPMVPGSRFYIFTSPH